MSKTNSSCWWSLTGLVLWKDCCQVATWIFGWFGTSRKSPQGLAIQDSAQLTYSSLPLVYVVSNTNTFSYSTCGLATQANLANVRSISLCGCLDAKITTGSLAMANSHTAIATTVMSNFDASISSSPSAVLFVPLRQQLQHRPQRRLEWQYSHSIPSVMLT